MSSDARPPSAKGPGKDGKKRGGKASKDVNAVLRRAYKSTLEEEIPASMLDLLDKLG